MTWKDRYEVWVQARGRDRNDLEYAARCLKCPGWLTEFADSKADAWTVCKTHEEEKHMAQSAEQKKVEAISNALALQLDALKDLRKRIKDRTLRNEIIQGIADLDLLICTLDDATTDEEER